MGSFLTMALTGHEGESGIQPVLSIVHHFSDILRAACLVTLAANHKASPSALRCAAKLGSDQVLGSADLMGVPERTAGAVASVLLHLPGVCSSI